MVTTLTSQTKQTPGKLYLRKSKGKQKLKKNKKQKKTKQAHSLFSAITVGFVGLALKELI